jgi:Fe-S cluster biogenesis protein NfuA
MSDSTAPANAPDDQARSVGERVREVIELMRPSIQDDGGDLELVGVSGEGLVRIRFHGACVGCPSSGMTLQAGIERNLRLLVPEVTGVVAVN